jgi:hypothetical protein
LRRSSWLDYLGVKHCFGASCESGTKSRQTLNTRYDLRITGDKGQPLNILTPTNDISSMTTSCNCSYRHVSHLMNLMISLVN